jgi:hypothetical protein
MKVYICVGYEYDSDVNDYPRHHWDTTYSGTWDDTNVHLIITFHHV